MKIPGKLNILGLDYEIVFRMDGSDPSVNSGSHSAWHNKIWITQDGGRTEKAQAQDLIHEIIEAINGANDLKLEHTVISTIASSLFQVLSDNHLSF